jgi:hypothetical protein
MSVAGQEAILTKLKRNENFISGQRLLSLYKTDFVVAMKVKK